MIPWARGGLSLVRGLQELHPVEDSPPASRAPGVHQLVYSFRGRCFLGFYPRLTIQSSLAAMRTTGLTPQAAMAATASCMLLSEGCLN